MGIPGLIHAIGKGERISLSKLAITHLERTARPIRIAVDISIWLFQVQAGRGGKNPELRTLFYRLLKLLALPVHPLFVYDGRQKPPFKRGKAVSPRSHGNAPIIQRSKELIERFRFPWHEAPGEAEAECARLQQAGIVDVVMSNDVDALMFGSTWTIMNFSKEKGTATAASTHVTCYHLGNEDHVSNVPLSRAGMILFAMLSGGDYLPGGVKNCGPGLAAEIAKAHFGEDLLEQLASQSPDLSTRLNEWRERLQYELEENESGYFATKHKAVRIPDTFPDQTILKYYAEPKVSTDDEMATLRRHLRHAWDREIDPLAIRTFAADNFEWNYRSGARKVIKLLTEPLLSYRLRLQRPVSGLSQGTLAPNCDTPWMHKVYKTRANFATDGTAELQMDMLPIDIVGLDLLAEEPNPPEEAVPSQEMGEGDEEDDAEVANEALEEPPTTPYKPRPKKRFDIFAIEKVWIFETVAKLGVPDAVNTWNKEQAAKEAAKEAAKAKKAAPKKPSTRRTGPKKKGPIDPGMKQGSILKYGMLTKERSDLSSYNKEHILEAASSQSTAKDSSSRFRTPPSFESFDFDDFSPSMYSQHQGSSQARYISRALDGLVDSFSSPCAASSTPRVKRHPMAGQLPTAARVGVLAAEETEILEFETSRLSLEDTVVSTQPPVPRGLKMSYSVSSYGPLETVRRKPVVLPKKQNPHNLKMVKSLPDTENAQDVDDIEKGIGSLSLSTKHANEHLPEQATPSFGSSCLKDDKKPTNKKSPSKKVPKIEKPPSEPGQSSGHVENISTADGFWFFDKPAESNTDKGDSDVPKGAKRDQKKRDKTKRIPRVSFIDLI
ncbi:uncharacterized protein N7484_006108 [Penicillium longicatenatum]|uniref:uncharacterized protein n=1 Tax=Penicillium longicatenatum TaxID=1561947 RepID=UPI002547143E|nr:uncharacterized protein N7484_006108 [Penicillium longicatenatum]KAJ5643601.1 hypothetical protein N7484_006108 [Penicillium longicatenatum]